MSNGFTPTKKDLLMVEELIIDLKKKKGDYVNRKISLQNSLSQLKEKYKDVDHNSKDFYRVKNTRQKVKDHLNGLEMTIKKLNDELSFKTKMKLEIDFYLRHNKSLETKEDIDRVVAKTTALKDKYQNFAKDRTRISSLRVLALEFVEDLNGLLKGLN